MQSCFLCLEICLLKTHKKATIRLIRSYQRYAQLTITTSNYIVSYEASLPTQQKLKGVGNKIVVGTVVKSKIGELQDEVRAGSLIKVGKEFTSALQGVSGSRRFLVRFHNGCENNLSSNQFTVMIIEKIPEDK